MDEYLKRRALTPEQAALRLDDPAMGPEFSVRIMNVANQHRVETVGALKARLDDGSIEKHWKGMGRKSINEIKDYLAHITRPTKDLFEDPEYVRYQMEDKLGTIQSLIADVQGTLLRAALKGRINEDARRHVAFKLRDAAGYAEQLPTYRGEDR